MSARELEPSGAKGVGHRVRAGLRRHGVIRGPAALRPFLRTRDLHFTEGNRIELFQDGQSGLASMLEAIETAARRIHLETYILRDDETGTRFLEALTEKARAGVEVRLLYDGVGSLGLDSSALAGLRAAGGDTVAFNPLGRLVPRWAPRRRDHRKVLVVDGRIGFTGGLNVGDEYVHGSRTGGDARMPWRDAHVRIEGPAVQRLDAVFLESWFRADGPDLPWDGGILPPAPAAGGEIAGVLPDGPTYRRRRMRDLMVSGLERASRRVRIVTPYFLPGPKLRGALTAAAARGVSVEVLIAGVIDHPMVRWASYAMLPDLVAHGVHIYEYDRAMMHAKAAVFDDDVAVIGTSNLDRQSLRHSYEVNLVVLGRGLPVSLSKMLEHDIGEARPFAAADAGSRFSFRRLRSRFAAFVMSRL